MYPNFDFVLGDVEEETLKEYRSRPHQYIKWFTEMKQSLAEFSNDTKNSSNGHVKERVVCRNTNQGISFDTDERGYLCNHAYLTNDGCCANETFATRFTCERCDQLRGCCEQFEKIVLTDVLRGTNGHRLRYILASKDQFELCISQCRTSSGSLNGANRYINPVQKYCYKLLPMEIENSRRMLSTHAPLKVLRTDMQAALRYQADMKKLDLLAKRTFGWFALSCYILIDALWFKYAIVTFVFDWVFPFSHLRLIVRLIALPALLLCLANAFTCMIAASEKYLYNFRYSPRLTDKQIGLLGLDSSANMKQSSNFELKPLIKSFVTNHKFLFDWLPALNFGRSWKILNDLRKASTPESDTSTINFMQYYETGAELDRIDPLEAKIGLSRSMNVSSGSIKTSKQVKNFLDSSAFLSGSFLDRSVASDGLLDRSGSYSQFQFSKSVSQSNSYELGTSMSEDDRAKISYEDTGIVSLITGSRIKFTNTRVSLSPIPLNLIDVPLDGTGDSSADKNVSHVMSGIYEEKEDSTSFRVAHNVSRKSSIFLLFIQMELTMILGSPGLALPRSNTMERRKALSPKVRQLPNLIDCQFAAPIEDTSHEANYSSFFRQIPLTSDEIMSQYAMDTKRFAIGERRLRMWISKTIIRPLVSRIDEVNQILSKVHAHLHLKIGHSPIEAIESALSSKVDLLETPLPYLIPYLKVHGKYAYLIHRARTLGRDTCMQECDWQSGGEDPLDHKDNEGSSKSYHPSYGPWGEHLPSDATLVWFWICVYFDSRLSPHPLAENIHRPFSSVYYLQKPSRPSSIQCWKDSFYVQQNSLYPPHFELVICGGRERFDVGRGARNLWRTILLFIQHARLFNHACLGNVRIDQSGLNIASILD